MADEKEIIPKGGIKALRGFPTYFSKTILFPPILLPIFPEADHALKRDIFILSERIRCASIPFEFLVNTTLNKGLKRGNEINAPYVIIRGENEIKLGIARIRDMKTGKQEDIRIEDVVDYFIKKGCQIISVDSCLKSDIWKWEISTRDILDMLFKRIKLLVRFSPLLLKSYWNKLFPK